MDSVWALGALLLMVLVAFLLPIKRRKMNVDEKGEAIKVYREEVKFLESQQQKGLIDADEQSQLLAELDRKSALAITAIAQHPFAYRRSWWSWLMVVGVLSSISGGFFWHYQDSGVGAWQSFKRQHRNSIHAGLFDAEVVEHFISQHNVPDRINYCFAMQHILLEKYNSNPDTLANLALCHVLSGYPALATDAVKRGLTHQPKHTELNYLLAEMDYLQHQRLSPEALDHLFITIRQQPAHMNALRLLTANSLAQGNDVQARFFLAQMKKHAANHPALLASIANTEALMAQKTEQESGTTTRQTTQPANKPSIAVSVELAPQFASIAFPQTVFVVTKTPEGQLLNASKHTLSSALQKLTLTITDHQAGAMQRQTMEGLSQVSVVARISLNHSPIAHTGDLTSAAVTVDVGQSARTQLLIDQKVP